MKNTLRTLALPLIALAFFVVPGEVRAWSTFGFTETVFSPLYGTYQASGESPSSYSCPPYSWNCAYSLNVFTKNYVGFSDGTGDPLLTPNTTVTVDIVPMTQADINPSGLYTKYSYDSCTNSNAGSKAYGTYYFYRLSQLFCVGRPYNVYPTGSAGTLPPNVDSWGGSGPYLGASGACSNGYSWPCFFTVVVIAPTPTIISSDPAVISCIGTSCTSHSVGLATLTINFPATISSEYEGWCASGPGCDSVRPFVNMPNATVPANSVTIPITVSPVAPPPNQIPTANITAPVANPTTTTQGNSLLFSGIGTDIDGTITQYEWTYGTCGTGTLISSNSSFDLNTVAGFPTGVPSTIYLRVMDNQGAWSTNCPSRTVTVSPPAPCSIIWGGESTWSSIPSGSTVTAYQSPTVVPPVLCVSQSRTCTNGTLPGTYTYQNCTSAPTFNFTPSSAIVSPGLSYNLIWNSVTNATLCTAGGDWSGNKTTAGSTEAMPVMGATTRTHTLSCMGAGGTTLKTVSVYPITSPPAITYFAPDATPIPVNTSTDLYWNVSGNGTTCVGTEGWSGVKDSAGGVETTEPLTTTTNYTLTCSNSAGSDTKSTAVTVTGGASVCGNSVCESGENPLICAKDCKVKYKQF